MISVKNLRATKKKMNTFVAFCFVAVLVGVNALNEQQIETIKRYHHDCKAESGVDPEHVTKARNGEFLDDPKLKEHLLCFSKKLGFQNAEGEIQLAVLKAKLSPEIQDEEEVEKLLTKCAIQKDTPQETAFGTVKCYYENTPKHISIA